MRASRPWSTFTSAPVRTGTCIGIMMKITDQPITTASLAFCRRSSVPANDNGRTPSLTLEERVDGLRQAPARTRGRNRFDAGDAFLKFTGGQRRRRHLSGYRDHIVALELQPLDSADRGHSAFGGEDHSARGRLEPR